MAFICATSSTRHEPIVKVTGSSGSAGSAAGASIGSDCASSDGAAVGDVGGAVVVAQAASEIASTAIKAKNKSFRDMVTPPWECPRIWVVVGWISQRHCQMEIIFYEIIT
jgi:hypothetical protein